MIHELKEIVEGYTIFQQKHLKTVLATVVALEGSSYRRPGVRMLICEDGTTIGAVSGGCVEKEIVRQSLQVLKTGIPRTMSYDGRYRLGCKGILYILIEPLELSQKFLANFESLLKERKPLSLQSYFLKEDASNEGFGTVLVYGDIHIPFRPIFEKKQHCTVFQQELKPCFQLMIIGGEHDAVQLCSYAAKTGWEVTIVVSATSEKTRTDFPGVHAMLSVEPDAFAPAHLDEQTAVMLMTHSYARDLQYLLALKDTKPLYLGLLGPVERREKLLNEYIERYPQVSDSFFDRIYGPAGLNIGSETAQEIAIAIMAEILSVARNKEPMMLKNKSGRIHS